MWLVFKVSLFVVGLIFLKAWRDKLTFDWKFENKNKGLWHISGVILLGWCYFFILWVLLPISWLFVALMFLFCVITWWSFDVFLNILRDLPVGHIGDSWIEKKLGKNIWAVKLAVTSLVLILLMMTL